MPNLDISELFNDPDLAGMTFSVVRSTQSIGGDGITNTAPVTLSASGAIYPSSDQEIAILPDEARIGAFITVVSTFRFVPLTVSNAPDIVIWENAQYKVVRTTDYRQYGIGFVQAVCQLMSAALDNSLVT